MAAAAPVIDEASLGPATTDTISLVDKDLAELPEDFARARGPHVKTLNLSENRLVSLRVLGHFTRLETLVLDKNGLADLLDCPPLPSVRTLWFNKNNVVDMAEFLSHVDRVFPGLTRLSVMQNPASPPLIVMSEEDIAAGARHRLYVVYRLPRLEHLDSRPVSAAERTEAAERGEFLMVRKAKTRATGAAATPSPVLAVAGVSDGAAAEDSASRRPTAYLGLGSSHYDGRHSEGNRFIVNDDL